MTKTGDRVGPASHHPNETGDDPSAPVRQPVLRPRGTYVSKSDMVTDLLRDLITDGQLSPELSRSVLRDQVRRLADAGTAVLLVEQKAFEALSVSDWAYILVAGRVEIAGAASEILDRPDIREVFLGQSATGPAAAPSPPGQAARDRNSPTHPAPAREP